ncbi:MAG: carbohydrate ABC transporter permease [Spirochaetota bacterium]
MTIKRIFLHAFAWMCGVIWVLPFIGIIMASLRPYSEIVSGWWDFTEFNPSIGNYLLVLFETTIPMLRPLFNSMVVSLLGSFTPMILGGLAGYAFARHQIPFKQGIIIILLSLLAIPLQMISVPIFRMMNGLGFLDSFISVTIFNTATAIPWIIFFMMNFFKAQPMEVEEAAKIDGASVFQLFCRIALPQAVPALISVFTLQFVWCWVDFFLPLIFLYSPEKYVAIQVIPMLRGQFIANWGALSAASVLVTAVPFILFLALQKYYIRGSVGWLIEK